MDKPITLLGFAKAVNQAYEEWRRHPDDPLYKQRYERAKAIMDVQILQQKIAVESKLSHK
jgi:hypothetical protein